MQEMYEALGVSRKVYSFGQAVLTGLRERFAAIDETAEYNQAKVLRAMQKNKLSGACFAASTGYGYNDLGRETLEAVYADCFHTESALVRPQITCGTHALALALGAVLRPGDELLSPVGAPYDTLEEVIGIRPSPGSLAEYGVTYRQADLKPDGSFDCDAIRAAITPRTKLITIQRSKGYATRPSFSVEAIGRLIAFCKSVKPDVLCMVDNCYGEFVERTEPSDVGADMTVGSLIKNPGGGLASAGGYICGTAECIEACARRLTAPGLGKEVGANLGQLPSMYQGFFLGSPERMEAFCLGIQAAAPVDSHVTPVPWPMPGYDSDVIMAAGAFVQGSSIELSADGPIRPPYAVYFQGGLTWYHAKTGILMSLQKLYERGLVDLKEI